MNSIKRKNIGLVISNLFLIIFLFFCVTPVWAADYDTMIILGSHLKSTLTNRVNGACDLIKSNNFNKIIVSGGCVIKSSGTTGLTCPYDCGDPNCTEASEMKKLLITKDPSLASKIVLENKSQSTASNYSHSKVLITPPGSSVVVVSDHEHVKAVSYALKHCDGFNAYYYFIGKTNQPQTLSIDDFANNDYSDIIKTCREKLGLGGTAAPSVTVDTGIPFVNEINIILEKPTPKISIPGLNFSEIKTVEEDGGTYLYIPFLGEYIAAAYKYGVVIASIIAVVMIITAGFGWAISGGEPEKINHAKTRIGQAIVGLFLAVGSYTLLYMINPELVKFRSLRIATFEPIPLSEAANEFYNSAIAESANYSDIKPILDPNFHHSSVPEPFKMDGAMIKDMATKAGIDPCLAWAIIMSESEGHSQTIGHDENYDKNKRCDHDGKCVCKPVGSRKKFLTSGKKWSGDTFIPLQEKYDPCIHNGTKIYNDDKFDRTKPPDYGLDWEFSHGIGPGQNTIYPGRSYSKKIQGPNGPEWAVEVAKRWYTITDLLNPDTQMEALILLIKVKSKKANGDVKKTFEYYSGGTSGVIRKMEEYKKCPY